VAINWGLLSLLVAVAAGSLLLLLVVVVSGIPSLFAHEHTMGLPNFLWRQEGKVLCFVGDQNYLRIRNAFSSGVREPGWPACGGLIRAASGGGALEPAESGDVSRDWDWHRCLEIPVSPSRTGHVVRDSRG
jgi:hypothetical protein